MLRAAAMLLAVLLGLSSAHADVRVALVIGNGEYAKVGALANPTRDASAMEALLRTAKFDVVEIKRDLGATAMRRALRDFSERVQGADIAVVFYAGHGIEVNGNNYLIPVDATLERDIDVEDETVPLERVMQVLDQAKRLRLVILDACRDNPFARSMKRTVSGRSIGRGLAKVEVLSSDTLVAFAARAGSTASDGEGGNSPYTTALVKHLTTPGLDLRLALGRVRDEVLKATSNRQEPFVYGSLGGSEIPLVTGSAPSPGAMLPLPASPQPSQAEIGQFCQAVASNPSLAVVQSLVETYRGTPMAACAQARLEELRKLAAATPPTPAPLPARPDPPPQPAGRGDVKVGVAGPFTGGLAPFGAQLKQGVELAVTDVNASGGILGRKLTVVPADDRNDVREAVAVAERLAADGVNLVIGHFSSGPTLAASDVYQAKGGLMIAPAATHPRLTERNLWNVFRTVGRDDQQGAIAGAIIAQRFRGQRVALLHDKTVYGQGLAQAVRDTLRAKGQGEVMFEGVNRVDRDFTALIASVKSHNPALVFWGGLYDPGALILRQMRNAGVKATFMAGDGIASSDFAQAAGPAAEGALMMLQPSPQRYPVNRGLVDAFRKKSGLQPEGLALFSYAAVQILKQAAEAAKALDPKSMAEVMRSGRVFKTSLGDFAFDTKGDVSGGYVVANRPTATYVPYVWKKGSDGRLSYVEE